MINGGTATGHEDIADLPLEERLQKHIIDGEKKHLIETLEEALKKYRTGGQQKMVVEHVHVNEGGQAIVGTVNQGGGGNNKKQ